MKVVVPICLAEESLARRNSGMVTAGLIFIHSFPRQRLSDRILFTFSNTSTAQGSASNRFHSRITSIKIGEQKGGVKRGSRRPRATLKALV
jgi:hypothetical protein